MITARATAGVGQSHEANGDEPPAFGNGMRLDDAIPLTDVGNAQRLIQRHGRKVRYCPEWKKWLVWDGRRWAVDSAGIHVQAMAQETILSLFHSAKSLIDLLKHNESGEAALKMGVLNQLLKHALRSQQAPRVNAMIDQARSQDGIPVCPRALDADPFLLNVANGTLDLRTGELRPHRPEDMLTKITDVEYRPDAMCPTWEVALDKWMNGNADLVGYLQRAVGYSLTADVSEQCLFFVHGEGSNGKTTFIESVRSVMGEYGSTAPPDLLMVRSGEVHPTERADLHSKRFVPTVEVDDGRRFAEALVKQLTGGDTIKGRRVKEDFWEIAPTWKIWLAANHKPEIKGQDLAIWRRIKLIPFTVTIKEEDKDKGIQAKLKAEASGILAWMVCGCLEWQRSRGLVEPAEVTAATASYRSEQDVLGQWLEEDCVRGGPDFRVKKGELYDAYSRYRDKQGLPKQTSKRVGQDLRRLGITEDAGKRWYVGVALRAGEEP